MKIRIIALIKDGELHLHPGAIVEARDDMALQWIEEGRAIEFDDEPKPKKSTKAVKDGDG